jgi:YegS/Rv2252/BmrU family lipid kinase
LVADFWRTRGWRVVVYPTQSAGHATELARQAAIAGHRLVLAAGGDGTLGEVANGLAGTEVVMAPLPVGTGNSFAKELRLPRPTFLNRHKLLQAADALAAGQVQRVDLGYVHSRDGGRYWLLWAGAGGDGFLINEIEPRPRWSKKLGALGYVWQSLLVLPRLPRMRARVEVDGRIFEDEYLLVTITNCRRYAGGELLLSPQAKMDDGLLEVWLFRGHGLAKVLTYLLQARSGRHRQNPNVTLANGRRVTVYSDPTMPCQTDGERAGATPLVCQVKPNILPMLIPNTAPADLFCRPGEALLP